MIPLKASVLVPSRRPACLVRCLKSLAEQSRPPDEVFVVWQGDDVATRDIALSMAEGFGSRLRVLHSPEIGIVPAENAALSAASGDVIFLIDDDAVAPPNWIERHLSRYQDPTVGAVGGPADNFTSDEVPFPRRDNQPVGRIAWFGRVVGNMNDQNKNWRSREPIDVDHLIGGNMSLRRCAFSVFQDRLKPYWQLFELEACMQVRSRGFRILFDFGNVVRHYPSGNIWAEGRGGDPTIKIYNPAFNHAFILGRYTAGMRRLGCLAYLLGVGTRGQPGLLGAIYAAMRFGHPLKEIEILRNTLASCIAGWRAGSELRRVSATPGDRAVLREGSRVE